LDQDSGQREDRARTTAPDKVVVEDPRPEPDYPRYRAALGAGKSGASCLVRLLERFFGPDHTSAAMPQMVTSAPITLASSGPEGLFMAMSSVPWKTETIRTLPPGVIVDPRQKHGADDDKEQPARHHDQSHAF
jgi:hypothetical protein